ncbi:DUF3313 domain-containing protein [Phyllobacterium sp. 0TCS1.6C]|uniref:DUF3313 domain-containing protein n=1 Tax=unclassified Phyllobacterium TaxID=2638441 RepID=UPI0022643544|nr:MULTISPECIES: DUF3313 domain-containing protein [unclassified Phyllobacterium]MCX8282533.1 DUF3313 domain-containing protein [Phyllobacterium sp. 0TCS1.6C]MCX8296413.1 DUF3313 domain-containing protein [Phyllobacterium sp. 0TCS1.6A]
MRSLRPALPLCPALPLGLALSLSLAVAGCASVPLKEGGTLTSYGNLGAPKGKIAKKRIYVDGPALAAVKTASIMPTTYAPGAASDVKSAADRALVTNVMDRALCVALSDKYRMVQPGQPADIIIRSVITDVVPTNKAMAGISAAVTVGSGFAMPSNIPVSVPRLPFGLGGLAVEAEAVDSVGVQRAAMVWARGANSIQDNPRYSEVGDAYGLATKFASDYSKMLIAGREPKAFSMALPSRQRVRSWLGGKPKYAACESYGRAPGLLGVVASNYGLPPQWTEKKPKTY